MELTKAEINKAMQNPHIRRMAGIGSKYGLEMGKMDIIMALDKPPVTCSACGGKTYFKPTVGAYVCSCGKIGR